MTKEQYPLPEMETEEDFSQWDLSLDALLGEEAEDDWEALLADYPVDTPPQKEPDPSVDMPSLSRKKSTKKQPRSSKPSSPVRKNPFEKLPKKALLFAGIGALALVICILAGVLIAGAMDPYDGRILPNTTIGERRKMR